MNCPICECGDHINDVPHMDYALGCDQCGAIFRRDMPTVEELEKFYTEIYPDVWHRTTEHGGWPSQRVVNRAMRLCHVISQFVETPPKIERHLDIGCGPGILLAACHQSFGGCESVGVDLGDTKIVSWTPRSDEDKPTVYKTLGEVSGTFDLITLNHFLEHLPNPMDWLRDLHPLLRDDGLMLVEVPNAASEPTALPPRKTAWEKRGYPPPHLVGFSQFTLNYAMTKAGYFVREVQTLLPLECHSGENAPCYITAIVTKAPMGQIRNTVERNFSQLSSRDEHPKLDFVPLWTMPTIMKLQDK